MCCSDQRGQPCRGGHLLLCLLPRGIESCWCVCFVFACVYFVCCGHSCFSLSTLLCPQFFSSRDVCGFTGCVIPHLPSRCPQCVLLSHTLPPQLLLNTNYRQYRQYRVYRDLFWCSDFLVQTVGPLILPIQQSTRTCFVCLHFECRYR